MSRGRRSWPGSRCSASSGSARARPRSAAWPITSPRSPRARPITWAAFAVTAGFGAEDLVAQFEREHDDYSAIMAEALADRLAEAFAECSTQRARRDWGYGREENSRATT